MREQFDLFDRKAIKPEAAMPFTNLRLWCLPAEIAELGSVLIEDAPILT